MMARQLFKKGDRVKLTIAGAHVFECSTVRSQEPSATVVGFGRADHVVRVLRDGYKTPISCHMDFWECA